MKFKNMDAKKVSVLVQVAFVLATAGGFYTYTRSQTQPTNVLVFNKELPANTKIQSNDLKQITIPKSATKSQKFITDPAKIENKVVSTRVFPGEFVTDNKIVEDNKKDPFESMDLSKYRKISLPIDYVTGMGGNLKRGDKVDLIYIGEEQGSSKGVTTKYNYTKTFLQDVVVYSVTTDDGFKYQDRTHGNKGENSNDSQTNGKNISNGGTDGRLSTITLAVTSDQAEQITARMKHGAIRIIGRFDNSSNQNTRGYVIGNGADKSIYSGYSVAEKN